MAGSILLIRHGETEWSRDGKHTSFTDLPLTEQGRAAADRLRPRLDELDVDHIWSSPRLRARETAERATGRSDIEVTHDLVEWDYGDHEGRTTADIRNNDRNDWDLWVHGSPGGESTDDVTTRARKLFERFDAIEGTIACFSHGHFLRAVGALWAGRSIELGRHLLLDTGHISKLTHARDGRAIESWNA